MAEKKYKTLSEFYPYYLTEHADPVCRALHFIGTSGVFVLPVLAIVTGKWWLLALIPVSGYGFAWAGHALFERNKPATFGLSHVIPGWTEGLQLMNVGDKYELYIPSELAYGAGGAGNKIGPHQALKFEVELLDVVDDTEPKSPAEASSSSAEKGELTSDDLQQ